MLKKDKNKLIISILLDSNSYSKRCEKIVCDLIECIKKEFNYFNGIDIQEISLLKNKQINFCRNCKTCFNTHNCILDIKDNMDIEKDNLKKSDLFIIATPIYEKNVSAFTKAFLDRVGYRCHTMEMLGKRCIIVVTGKFSGINEVCKYLYEICSYMGFNVIAIISDNSLKSSRDLSSEIDFMAKRVSEMVVLELYNTSNMMLESIYQKYKYIYLDSGDDNFECSYWKNSQFIENYEEFCGVIKNLKVLDNV